MHSAMRTLLGILALLVFGNCVSQPLPEIYRVDPRFPNDFVDIELSIASINCPVWERCQVHAVGRFHGDQVGLDVLIGKHNGRTIGIVYRSTGEESNRLLAALSLLYKQPLKNSRFRREVYGDIVVLDARDGKMSNKVFFSVDGPESDYAELYTNVDKVRGVIQIREKDFEYRRNVLKAFAE